MRKRYLTFLIFPCFILLILMFITLGNVVEVENKINYSITDSSIYYPLKIGNTFYYRVVQDYSTTSYFAERIIDTITFHGKKYYKISNFLGYNGPYPLIYIRFDTISGFLKIFDSTNTSCDYETMLFKLNAIPLDTIGKYCSFINLINWESFFYHHCTTIGKINLFNDSVYFKQFDFWNVFLNLTVTKSAMLARNFGICYSITTSGGTTGSITWQYYLKGAKINDIVYGDTIITYIKNISAKLPSKFTLSQNFPNPFNPTTTIKFDIQKSSIVKISVYDLTGKEIEVLVNEKLQAGAYKTTWNASNFSNGVYFYRLQTEDYSDTKKLILLK